MLYEVASEVSMKRVASQQSKADDFGIVKP